ncbi:unnamed protein product [Didymodactylos carnosus]|uniref:Uncharacterized protein n=1 Tax=Didymodactylos carnosus TaxID=1234261 RepID=A0A813RJR6_9BILA|nr:unnamed protein product [Didymodactylos carnosus]CAF1016183.1 unnamed protein product [Didymodactylos carnosus]CAF3566526.1 unnamed protein product [Didymodactylos carnosus]CAF3785261.1 unnamed protein product [Didymodactylos carnosus]
MYIFQGVDCTKQRYSELSDEIRAQNKREDRLLDLKIKYYERETRTRLTMLQKEKHLLLKVRDQIAKRWKNIDDQSKHFKTSSILRDQRNNLFHTDSSYFLCSSSDIYTGSEVQEDLLTLNQESASEIIISDKELKHNENIVSNKIRPHSAV